MTENDESPELKSATRPPGVFDEAFLTGVEGVTEVILVRHAQQDFNLDGVAADWVDPPLTEQGRAQAALVGEALATKPLQAIFASPLKRAKETAEAIAKHHTSLEIEFNRELREVEVFRDVPADKTVREFMGDELLMAARLRMLNERSWDVYPYSESSYDFKKRAINAVETAIARNAGERIAVVCHGGVINAYTGHIVRSPYDMFFRPGHASVSIVAAGGARRVLRLLNDTHHLTTAEGDFATY